MHVFAGVVNQGPLYYDPSTQVYDPVYATKATVNLQLDLRGSFTQVFGRRRTAIRRIPMRRPSLRLTPVGDFRDRLLGELDPPNDLPQPPSVPIPDDLEAVNWSVTARSTGIEHAWNLPNRRLDLLRGFGIPARSDQYGILVRLNWSGGNSVDGFPTTEARRILTLRERLIVSLGDSYASGEGNPDQTSRLTNLGNARCEFTSATFAGEALAEKLRLPQIYQAANSLYSAITPDVVEDLVEGVGDIISQALDPFTGESKTRSVRWLDPRAHRSTRSAPARAAALLETIRGNDDAVATADVITFVSLAVSGATTTGVRGQRGQIARAIKSLGERRPDAVLLSIGGNDAGFSDVVTDLTNDLGMPELLGGLGFGFLGVVAAAYASDDLDEGKGQAAVDRLTDVIRDTIGPRIAETLVEVATRLNPRYLFMTEYPVGLFTSIDDDGRVVYTDGCGFFDSFAELDISRDDARAITILGRILNTVIRQTVEKLEADRMLDDPHFEFVTAIDRPFAGHGYCSPHPWYVSAEESCKHQDDFRGLLHPNEPGTSVMASAIAAVLRRRLFGIRVLPADVTGVPLTRLERVSTRT
jgi:hypothetical protein